jgi:hypothetical protein
LKAGRDTSNRHADLARDEVVTSEWRLMVIQNCGDGEELALLSELADDFQGFRLGLGIGIYRAKVEGFILGRTIRTLEDLRGGGLNEAGRLAQGTDTLEQHAHGIDIDLVHFFLVIP